MSMLFSPVSIGALTLRNRIIIPPMCQYAAEHGLPGDWHLMHYGQLALSGAGMLIVEATAVTPEGRISARDLGLWSDETEAAFSRMIRSIRRHAAMPLGVQLAHAGRKASQTIPWLGGGNIPTDQGGWRTVAPSPFPFAEGEQAPLELTEAGIDRVVDCFVQAARRADRAGFDCVEVHMAHGYLLHEFLSPLANARTDAYGGALENRMRLPLRVFDAVRAAFPAHKAVGARLSAQDWVEGGWTLEESVRLSAALHQRGVAYVHVSSAGLSPAQVIKLEAGYQVPFAERIRHEVGVPTIAVGLITTPEQAEDVIASGKADMVAIGRGMMYDPRWPWHAAAALGASVDAPPQYLTSAPRAHKGLFKPVAR